MGFGKSATYHKKAIFKFRKAKGVAKKATDKKPQFVEKKIGGDKNGGSRMVRVKRLANNYPTKDPKPAGTSKNFFSKHARKLRASLAPGALHQRGRVRREGARQRGRQVLPEGQGREDQEGRRHLRQQEGSLHRF